MLIAMFILCAYQMYYYKIWRLIMNKKILALLVVFFAAVSIASACAAELTNENDFDGLCKMKISPDDNFTQYGDPDAFSSLLRSGVAYQNNDSTIFVLFFKDCGMDQCIYVMSDDTIKRDDLVKEGDLTLFNATPEMSSLMEGNNITTFAGVTGESGSYDDTVIIGGTNETLVKEYASTVSFE